LIAFAKVFSLQNFHFVPTKITFERLCQSFFASEIFTFIPLKSASNSHNSTRLISKNLSSSILLGHYIVEADDVRFSQ
jgi:hypothetical protein